MLEEIEDRYPRTLASDEVKSGMSGLKAALKAWESELKGYAEFEAARSVFMAAREKAGEELFNRIKSRLEIETGETVIPGLERVLELQPYNQEAVQVLKEVKIEIALGAGFNSYKEENYSQAITYFQEVLSLDPEHSEALKYLRYARQCLEGGFRTRFKHLDL
jgi:tetratricopeptide (TPR) repeat protein